MLHYICLLILSVDVLASSDPVTTTIRDDWFLETFDGVSGPLDEQMSALGVGWEATPVATITSGNDLWMESGYAIAASGLVQRPPSARWTLQVSFSADGLEQVGVSLWGDSVLSIALDSNMDLIINGRVVGELDRLGSPWVQCHLAVADGWMTVLDMNDADDFVMAEIPIEPGFWFDTMIVSGTGLLDHIWGFYPKEICVMNCEPNPTSPEPTAWPLLLALLARRRR